MDKFNRAVRRHHTARLKHKRQFFWGYPRNWGALADEGMSPKQLGRVIQYPKACSCAMCGNQRAYDGRSLNERCGLVALAEGLRALDDDTAY